MDSDPIISCISYVIRKTCITFGVLLGFLGERLLDLIGLVFNILAFCTIIRIPGLIGALSYWKFRWTWKFAGIWQLAIFIMDIPLYATIPFYIMCPWRICMVVAGVQKNNEFNHFYWEGGAIRWRIWKHFVLLIFDILSIPFAICLALSWRSVRVYNLYLKCDKKETTVKFLIVSQFLHLLSDFIALPFTLVLMLSWRSPIILKRFIKYYYKKESSQGCVGNDVDLRMKGAIIRQSMQLFVDLLTMPPMIITLFSWRIIFFISSCSRAGKSCSGAGKSKFSGMTLNKLYSWLRKKFWQNAFYFFIDIPCILILLILVILLPVLPWRLIQYVNGIGSRLSPPLQPVDTLDVLGADALSSLSRQGKSQKARQQHERKLLLVAFCFAVADIISMIASLIIIATIWRVPFLIHECWEIHKGKHKKDTISEGMISGRFCLKTSLAMWRASLVNCVFIFVDAISAILGLAVMVTIWRAFPLACSINNAFSPKDPDDKVSLFTVNGMKIRRNIAKHFVFLLVDIPAICLCFLHIPFIIKLPAILSVVIGGNFYLEFALTVYMETAKLLVDLVFFVIFLFMCFVRPVAIWIHILEDERHKKHRLSSDSLVHIRWMLKQRDITLKDAESMMYTLIKEPSSLSLENQKNYAEVCLSKVLCKFTKKLEKVRNQLYDEELDDQIIYHLSKVIFFENKAASMMGRKFEVEKMYMETSSVIAHRRNLDMLARDESAYSQRSDKAFESLQNYKFTHVPLWQDKVGLMERSRKETQKAIITAVTSGNFVTVLLCFVNIILLYRAPVMMKSIWNAPHLRRKIALKTLRSYLLDYLMIVKIFLICLTIYKVPDLISALVVSLLQKRSIKAARKAVNAIPSDILLDIARAIGVFCSWQTIAFAVSSLLFLLLMPLSVMVKIFANAFKYSIGLAYCSAGLLYLLVVSAPFILALAPEILVKNHTTNPENLSTTIAGYVLLVVIILLTFVYIKPKGLQKEQLLVKDIDYVRINWFNIHVYVKIFIEFIQLMALIYTVKLMHFPYHSTFSTIAKYILLDVYDSKVKLSLACILFIVWFLTASIPIVLEGILKYVPKGTFTKSHFTWRAFLSFFGTTLFIFIPEVSLSFLACDYSNCHETGVNYTSGCAVLIEDSNIVCWNGEHLPIAIVSLLGMMWYLLTSILICLSFNDVYNRKIDLQFSPTYTAVENIFKVGIITALTLFRNNIYSLVPTAALLLILILITCLWKVLTKNKVCNRIPLIFMKVGCLIIVLCSTVLILVVEKLETKGNFALYVLGGIIFAVVLCCAMISYCGVMVVQSEQERARNKFKTVISKFIGRLGSLDAFVYYWQNVKNPYKRMLRHVRVAHPQDKTFDSVVSVDRDVLDTGIDETVPPPNYEDLPLLESLPAPPSYESILTEQQDKLQADSYFVPSASIYLSPFGDWETYDAGKILEAKGWMISADRDYMIELTDVQCSGSHMLLLLEQNIKYTAHSFAFVQSLATWRDVVKKSTWIGLLQCAEDLERSVDSSFERPLHANLSYEDKELIPPNPDSSTFPMYFELGDVTSMKMTIHKRELETLLSVIPEPWNGVFAKIIPNDKPLINRVMIHEQSSANNLTIHLFKRIIIVIKDIDTGGFKIAKGAKIILPKSINITTINDSIIRFSKPYLSGSKGPITKHIDSLNCKKIDDIWYVVLGDNRAKFSKILATLHKLEFQI